MSTQRVAEHVVGEVRAHMARKRLTGVELAECLNVSQQSASDRLTGKVRMSLDETYLVAQWLEVDVADLFPRAEVAA